MKILVLCTGNSCRSQMAEGFFKSFNPELEVFSAGTEPSGQVNLFAIKAMKEIGIDISSHTSDHVDQYIDQSFDYVITVCDDANEKCPYFTGNVTHRLHMGFDDPANAVGTEEEILPVYRRVRDEIGDSFKKLYEKEIKNQI
jgi:arsenate reductase (thioredoxin)